MNTNSTVIEFQGHGGIVNVTVIGYENVTARSSSDANWLRCTVDISIGAFSGTARVSITTNELDDFYRELQAALASLSGDISLKNLEDDVEISVKFNANGTATITGFLQVSGETSARLNYRYESDQTFLGVSCMKIQEAVVRFPFVHLVH